MFCNLSYTKKFFLIFSPFAMGFILSCLFRTMSSILLPAIGNDISIPINKLGFLLSIYFLAYAIFQAPLGFLLDQFGARKVQFILFMLAAISLIYFSRVTNLFQIGIAYSILGIGMAGGLMGAFKTIIQWFDPSEIPVLNGIMMTFGGVGILFSAAPTVYLTELLGWRDLLI